jgi:hypothetical protein
MTEAVLSIPQVETSAAQLTAAVSGLGRCLPSFRVSEREVLIAVKAFFDGSGAKSSEFLTLSGVAAKDWVWADFEHGWNRILASHPLKPTHLHMNELAALRRDFSIDKGWTKELGNQLVTSLLMYAQQLDKERFRTFRCSIDMEAYRLIQSEGHLLPDPYELCVFYAPQRVLAWYMEYFHENFPEKIHYFFDRNEKFKGRFENRWNRGKKARHDLSTHWDLVGTIASVDSRDHPEVQLADMCAWARNRFLVVSKHGHQAQYTHLSHFNENVLPLDCRHWDEEALRLCAVTAELYPKVLTDRSFPA